jgi:heme-degrading monooxygenase HmoA
MFARVVELTAKSAKAQETANTVGDKVVAVLRQQTGFLEASILTSETESNRVLAISFWKTKEDAERYNREQYPKVKETISQLIEGAPIVRNFNVHTSTSHKIAAGKGA